MHTPQNLQPLKIAQILDKALSLYPKFFNLQFLLLFAILAIGDVIPGVNIITYNISSIYIISIANNLWLNPNYEINLSKIKVSGKIWKLILLSLTIGLGSILWGILLIVPGIIYALNRSFSKFPMLLENKSNKESMLISKELMQYPRSQMRLSCIYLLYFVLIIPLMMAGSFAIQSIFNNKIITEIIIGFLGQISLPFFLLCELGLYSDIRIRNEGLDIKHQIDSIHA